jgi:hypothetical protein
LSPAVWYEDEKAAEGKRKKRRRGRAMRFLFFLFPFSPFPKALFRR